MNQYVFCMVNMTHVPRNFMGKFWWFSAGFGARTHASGGVSEGAPFGFLSHGVGGQFMALLAYRLKQDRTGV